MQSMKQNVYDNMVFWGHEVLVNNHGGHCAGENVYIYFLIHTFLSISKLLYRHIITVHIFDYFGSKLLWLFQTMIQICSVIDHAFGGGIYFDHAWLNIHLFFFSKQ